jgi:hypothetical protein
MLEPYVLKFFTKEFKTLVMGEIDLHKGEAPVVLKELI